jgi:hypothetical protein
MTTLSTILAGLPADDAEALTAVRAYQVTERTGINSTVLAMAMVEAGLYADVYDLSLNTASEYRGHALYLLAVLGSNSDIDFNPGTDVGQANISLLQAMGTALGAKLNVLRNKITQYTVSTRLPFANATLHDVKIARNTCPVKAVSQSNGFAVITLLSDVEAHNPRLLADNPRTGERVRINNFRGVSSAGKYEAMVPGEWRGASLYVDDVFGAL